MAGLTSNLQKWLRKLETIQSQVPNVDVAVQYAFVELLNEEKLNAHKLLADNARKAIRRGGGEYNQAIFKDPLNEAIMNNETIYIKVVNNRIAVEIDLNKTAGRIEDYAQAVESVRSQFGEGTTIRRASHFWEHFIYKPARTTLGMSLRKNRREGGLSELGDYTKTIKARLGRTVGIAPFWELIDKGVYGTAFPDRGGRAYPEGKATNFVSMTKIQLETSWQAGLNEKVELIESALDRELYGGRTILEELERAISDLDTQTQPVEVGQILTRVELASKQYKLYVTSKGKLGFSQ